MKREAGVIALWAVHMLESTLEEAVAALIDESLLPAGEGRSAAATVETPTPEEDSAIVMSVSRVPRVL